MLKLLQDNFDAIINSAILVALIWLYWGSTTPLELLTPFILIFVTNFTKGGWCFWVFGSIFYFKAVYSVFINCSWRPNHPCPSCKCMSSSSSRLRLTVLSPTPFWPSSNSWKLQGTFTPKPVVAATLHHCHSFPYSAFSFQSYIPRVPWLQAPSSNFSAVASLFCFCTYMLPSCTNEAEVLDIFMVWPWKSHNIPSLIVYWWRQSKKKPTPKKTTNDQ